MKNMQFNNTKESQDVFDKLEKLCYSMFLVINYRVNFLDIEKSERLNLITKAMELLKNQDFVGLCEMEERLH